MKDESVDQEVIILNDDKEREYPLWLSKKEHDLSKEVENDNWERFKKFNEEYMREYQKESKQ